MPVLLDKQTPCETLLEFAAHKTLQSRHGVHPQVRDRALRLPDTKDPAPGTPLREARAGAKTKDLGLGACALPAPSALLACRPQAQPGKLASPSADYPQSTTGRRPGPAPTPEEKVPERPLRISPSPSASVGPLSEAGEFSPLLSDGLVSPSLRPWGANIHGLFNLREPHVPYKIRTPVPAS